MLQKKQFNFLQGKPARKLPSEHVFNVNREEKLATIHKNKEKNTHTKKASSIQQQSNKLPP
jgi:hypothetical protein